MGGTEGQGLTEEGLRAGHTGREAIEVDAASAVRVPQGKGLLHPAAERETHKEGPGHGRVGLGPASSKVSSPVAILGAAPPQDEPGTELGPWPQHPSSRTSWPPLQKRVPSARHPPSSREGPGRSLDVALNRPLGGGEGALATVTWMPHGGESPP